MVRCAFVLSFVASSAAASPATQRAVEAASMQMARVGPAIVDDAGLVYAIGGENAEGPLRSIEMWNEDHSQWEAVGKMRSPRVRHTATLLDDGDFLVVGGGPRLA